MSESDASGGGTGLSPDRTLDLVSEVVDYAIIGLDADGVIRSWNKGARLLKGYSADEAVGQHFSMFYVPEDREAGLPEDLLEVARREGRSLHTGWRVRKDGTQFWGDVVITALHDDDGKLTGFGKVTRDRTDQHRLEELQNSLFAMMSHDIRQPLTAIGIHAGLIADLDAATRREYAERILDSAEQLESMIGTLFDHARLRAGVVAVYPDPLPLGPALREAVAANEHLLAGREVTVDDDGVIAMADAVALRRVLGNLLVNAAKYSPAGSPIDLIARATGQTAVIRIVDHGRGVAAEDIPNIFTEFYRGRLAAENDGGSGLGLASVKHLVERQDGTVRLDSTLGVGTTVTVTLPRANE